MVLHSVEFVSSDSVVQGYFFPSTGDPAFATVIFLQGFPGIEGDELICERLAQESVNVLTFNYRGTFRSEGYFSFSHAVADVDAALQFLREPETAETYAVDPERIVLGGWSFGAGILFAGAVRHGEIRRIFAISGRDFGEEARRIAGDQAYAEEVTRNLAAIRAPSGPVRFQDDLLADLIENQDAFDSEKLAPRLKDRDVLLIGGWDDGVSAIEDHILPFYRLLSEQGTSVRIEAFQDDHEFSESRDRLAQVILSWLSENGA